MQGPQLRLSGVALIVALGLVALAPGGAVSTESAHAATASGLVAAYSFDAGSGSTLVDESGNGNDGSISGAVWATYGKYGKALRFDGLDDVVTIPDDPSLDLSGALTLEAWVRPDVLGFWKTVLMKEQPGNLTYGLFADSDSAQPTGQVYVGGQQIVRGTSQVSLTAWTHLATTYDGLSQKLYVNGQLAGSRVQVGPVAVSNGVLRIGGNTVYANEYFDGRIDDVRIYSRALSESEIETDMATPVAEVPPPPPPPASDLVTAYGMDAGSGSTLADDSGNGNAGTLAGPTWEAAGKFGKALRFDGVDDWVTILDAAELNPSAALTLEAWVKPDALGFWKTVLMKEQPGNLTYGLFADSDSAEPTGQVYVGSQQIVRGSAQLAVGTWTHLATTYDGVAQRIYVNGVEISSRPQAGSVATSNGVLRVGGNAVYANEFFDGVIDEVRVYARALPASEIQTDMATAITGAAPPPPPPAGDTTPPTAPSGLTKTGSTTSSVSVAWTASSDNVGVAGYDVFRNGVSAGTTSATSYAFSGLSCGTSYTFGVEAFDAAGNNSIRSTLSASTSACPSSGASLYLSPSGSDSGSCSQSAPCRSINYAYRTAQPGQVVEMAGGSYAGGSIGPDSSKTSTSDVVFRPAPGANVTVTGELQFTAKHIEFRDLDLDGGWKALTGADDITFRNVHHKHFFIWSASNISVIGGDVGTDGTRTSYDSQLTEYSGSRIAPTNILIDGVRFHDWIDVDAGQANHIECLQVGAGVNVTIRNSRFEDCGTHDIFIRSWGGINGGIHQLRNWLIENNFFSRTTDGYYAIQFVNDLGFSNADFLVRHNSFLQGIYIDGPNTTVTVDSNIFSEQASWGCSGDVYRYNIYETLQGSGGPCGSTDRVAPVQYVNRAALDLHLRAGSPGMNEGNPSSTLASDIDGQVRPMGGRADAGADEAG